MRSIIITFDCRGYYRVDLEPGPPNGNEPSNVTFLQEADAEWGYVKITGPGGPVEDHALLGKSGRDIAHHYDFSKRPRPILYKGTSATFTFIVGPTKAKRVPPQTGTVTVP